MSSFRFVVAFLVILVSVECLVGCHVHVVLGPVETTPDQLVAERDFPMQSIEAFGQHRGPSATVAENPADGTVPNHNKSADKNRQIRHAAEWQQYDPQFHKEPAVLEDEFDVPLSVVSDSLVSEAEAQPLEVRISSQPIANEVNRVTSAETQLAAAEPSNNYPIDFPTVLRLAGAENWDIQLAAERIHESQINLDAAKALWLPSLTAGIGYTKHDGRIQDTLGNVVEVSRNAFFVGGGTHVGNAPLTGGSGGPARFFVDLSLTDAIYEPLVARQLTGVAHARHTTAYNDTLLQASLAYYELIRAQGQLANSRADYANAQQLATLTSAFVASGKGSRADTARIRTELTTRQQQVVESELAIKVASAQLARILQLDAETVLFTLEDKALPINLVSKQSPLTELVARGLQLRPEVARSLFQLEASCQRVQAERLRPFIPNVFMGASSGGFGGGPNNRLTQLDGRADFDIGAVWELRNLGLGTRAAQKRSSSQYRQAVFDLHRTRDMVIAEITQAYHQVHAQKQRIELAESNVREALESYEQDTARIRGLEGLPLEALQAIQAVARANDNYLGAVVNYNQAQARLLRATGMSIESEAPNSPS